MKYQFPMTAYISGFVPQSFFNKRTKILEKRQNCLKTLNLFLKEHDFLEFDESWRNLQKYTISNVEQLFLLFEKFDVRILNIGNQIDILVDLKGFNFRNY